MAEDFASTLKKLDDLVRETAADQGAAYLKYGQALTRFGSGGMGVGDLAVSAGNLYIGEVRRLGTTYFKANAALANLALDRMGIRILQREAKVVDEKPADRKTTRRRATRSKADAIITAKPTTKTAAAARAVRPRPTKGEGTKAPQ